ncbi:MAG: HAD hydrolase-like protein, partial [Oscillospiraceae bacterium]
NKPHEQLLAVINKLFPPNLFTKILGKVDSFPQKPSPESLEYLMHSFNVSKNETIYIGDSNVDMTLGTNAKVQTIGVEWGFRDRTELEEYNATYIVKKPNELFDIVCK